MAMTWLASLANASASTAETLWSAPIRGSWAAAPSEAGLVLVGEEGPCEIVVDPREDTAIHQAARFLAGDIKALTGYQPAIVPKPTRGRRALHLATLGMASAPREIARDRLEGQWEAYQIFATDEAAWLVGSNFRGTAFAAYTLSERLGIDPLYHWTGYAPEPRFPLILKNVNHIVDPPTFKYRGAFHDDLDIIPRPYDENGHARFDSGVVATEWYERFFETALRLRMNMVAPYTHVIRRFEVQRMASEWGLFYTSHHYDILLSDPYGFQKSHLAAKRGVTADWDWRANRDGMLRFWRAGVEENKSLRCIWPVGIRGLADHPYYFPPDTTAEEKFALYREAIGEQMRIVRESLPAGEEPLFHFTIWSEMLEAYKSGTLKVPPEVNLIWTDYGYSSKMRALPEKGAPGRHGVYFHLAFAPSTLQIGRAISEDLIAEEFRKILDSDATEFLLVNVSETREYVRELRMIADIGWDARDALAPPKSDQVAAPESPGRLLAQSLPRESFPDETLRFQPFERPPDAPAERFSTWFAQEYYGEAAPGALEGYRWHGALIYDLNRLRYASQVVPKQVAALKRKFAGEAFEIPGERIETVRARAGLFARAMKAVERASEKMTPSQRQFFYENVTLGMLIDYRPTQAALKLHEALLEPEKGKAVALVREALEPLRAFEAETVRAERPPFEEWYVKTAVGVWLGEDNNPCDIHRAYRLVSQFLASLKAID